MEQTVEKLINISVDLGIKLIFALVVLIVGLKIAKWVSKRIERSRILASQDGGVRKFTANAAKIALYIIVIISAAGILGIPYASFVAVIGSAGVAIGLALQGSLSNIAACILILVTKPFSVGDFIKTDEAEGEVGEIGFFFTAVKTIDNKMIYCPNSAIANARIVNYTKLEKRRVDIEFSVGYGSDTEKVKEVIISAASAHPLTLEDPAPFARMLKHGDSGISFIMRVWCMTKDYWTVYFDLMETIKAEFDKNGIEIPYPQMDVHVKKS